MQRTQMFQRQKRGKKKKRSKFDEGSETSMLHTESEVDTDEAFA